ncbi:MAG: EAL domain-containing protein [Cryobacterium sp.]
MRRLAFLLLASTAVILILGSVILLIAGPASRWPVALFGVVCAAGLEIGRIRMGTVPYRTPVINLPIVALPALSPFIPAQTAIGIVALGVLLMILARTHRLPVALYGAGLAGAGAILTVALYGWLLLAGAPVLLAVAAGCAAYVVFVVSVEIMRLRFVTAPLDLGGRGVVSPVRVAMAALASGLLGVLAAVLSTTGLPYIDGGSRALNVIVVLLGLTMLAGVAKIVIRGVIARRRLTGMIAGASELSAGASASSSSSTGVSDKAGLLGGPSPTESDDARHVSELLCRSVADTIGVESVTVRDQPASAPGEISVPVSLRGKVTEHVVARRDPMSGAFTADDRSALQALAHTASVVVKSRRNLGGLTLRANTDPLTGLPNYGAFQAALANINEHRDYSEAIAVLFIDLDDFKRMNDRYGHQVGDGILSELGRRLRVAIRPHDVVARVGGDEFVIILTRLSSLAEANAVAERVMTSSGAPITIGSATVVPVVSIGLAYSAHRETDVNELVKDADRSMLAIKKSNRRGGPAKESSINISGHRSSEMNDIIARAIDDDLLQLAFQPVVSLVTGQIWAFEALVRYTHPELGPLSPSSLVEKAKGLGRLDLLTRQVAVKAMAAAAEFRLLEPRITCMTINVEAGQILPERMGDFVEGLAFRYPAISICLELNERSMARVTPAIRAQADRLRDLGLMIALDDYGSQDSSVDALVRMPMDILKIDRSLVDDLDDVRQREVLTALQGFGDSLEYSMIVEGVENERMADHLGALGIRSAQGFHYGVPQSFENTIARLEEFGARAVLPPGARQYVDPPARVKPAAPADSPELPPGDPILLP